MSSVRQNRDDCPDLESIAAYLDNGLSQADRLAVEAHLVSCERCYDLFAEAAATLVQVTAPGAAGRRGGTPGRRTWIYGAMAAAASVMVVMWARPYVDPTLRLNRHVATVVMAGPERPFDVRLTGEDRWRPVAAPERGTSRIDRLSAATAVAFGRIGEEVESGRTGPRLAALGRAHLALGRVDEGLNALEEALALGEATPPVLSDLGAGYIARAQVPERAGDLPRALDLLNQALAMDDGRRESLFNRAIVLERLNLRPEAIEAWEQYLEIDPDSGWAAEARERLGRLKQEPQLSDAGAARDHLLTCFLPVWAAGVLNGRDPAPGLADARTIVHALSQRTRDTYAHDVVERTAALSREPQIFERALRAVVTYGDGRAKYALAHYEPADTSLAIAADELQRLDHPLALTASLDRGLIAYRGKDYEGAHRLLEPLVRPGHERNYAVITGRVYWARGLMWLIEGRLRDSAVAYQTAIEALTEAGNAADAAFVVGLLATSYDRLGDPVRVWQARVQALQGSSREGTLLRAAAEARRDGWLWASRDFAAAAARSAKSTGRPPYVADTLRWQAIIESELGHTARADSLLAEARTAITAQADPRVSAEIDLATAIASTRTGDAEAGIAAASRALDYFSSGKSRATDRLPEILLTRARLASRIGATDRARADLEQGLAIYLQMRQFANPGVDQATLADVARRLTDELVVLIAPSDEDGAFREVERVRAWDLASAGADETITLPAARDAVPDSALVVSYVVGDSATRLWTLRRGRSRLMTIPAGRKQLGDLVAGFRSPTGEAAGRELARLLVEPLEAELRPGDLLALVPDGPLHQLPFGALKTSMNRYLVEDHALVIGPSVSSLLRRVDGGVPATAMLAIGNPEFTRAEWPGLADLPGAAREAQMLVRDRPGSVLLHGAGATREAVVQHLARASVVHFAGHAVVNAFIAAESALVLAGRDRLKAGEVRTLRLDHVGLVVLASCESAGGYQPRSDGPMGLARAFQAAGVKYVLAALRPVDDGKARTFFTSFHASLAEGRDPAAALRDAQLQAIARDPSPGAAVHWSSYVLTGPLKLAARAETRP